MLTDQIKNVFDKSFCDISMFSTSVFVFFLVMTYINWTTWIQCPHGKHWKNSNILSMYTDSIDAVHTNVWMGNLDPTEGREKQNKDVYLIT